MGEVHPGIGAMNSAKKCLIDGEWKECAIVNKYTNTAKDVYDNIDKTNKAYEYLEKNY